MPVEPGSPADWLRFARSDLEIARSALNPGVLLDSLCFHAQQAAEKSLKAVLLAKGIPFPRTHNLRVLLDLLPEYPLDAGPVAALTVYAVVSRYPGEYEPVSHPEYLQAVEAADGAVRWAERLLAEASGEPSGPS